MRSACAELRDGTGIESGSAGRAARNGVDAGTYERVDTELVRRAQAGCATAFAALHGHLVERVRRMALRILRDEHEVEDVTQDTFLAAFRGLGKLQDLERFEPWLIRIAFNLAVDRARRTRRCRPAARVHDEASDDMASIGRVVSRKGSAEPSPASVALFRAEFDALGDQVRETVRLRYRRGLSCVRIAREQGVSLSCVKTRLHRARRRLREAIRAGVA